MEGLSEIDVEVEREDPTRDLYVKAVGEYGRVRWVSSVGQIEARLSLQLLLCVLF